MDRFEYSRFYHLIPAQKHYAWGSETKIQSLIGIKPYGKPLAEIWMGNYPNGLGFHASKELHFVCRIRIKCSH